MPGRSVGSVVLVAALATLFFIPVPRRAAAATAVVRPALDGIFAAFQAHPLVGIGDFHELADEEAFYGAVVRDPRFAASVGNIVVEFGGSQRQDILDRYVAGEAVPYHELSKVWRETVGWDPTVLGVGYETFFAQVRAVNLKLPPDRRIRVWLGEPPIDWSAVQTKEQWQRLYDQRDRHAAEVIERRILAAGRKALVIYGTNHFNQIPWPSSVPAPLGGPPATLREIVERSHPGAFFVITPYAGYAKADCSAAFEAEMKWPKGSLVSPVKDTSVETALLRADCLTPNLRIDPPPPADELARLQAREYEIDTGVAGDALLYLGPAADLMRTPTDPTVWMDEDYHREIMRRARVKGRQPLSFAELVPLFAAPPRPLWPR